MKGSPTDLSYVLYASDDTSRPAVHATIDGNERSVQGPTPVPADGWTHLTAMYDGARIRLYVNGVLVRTGSRVGNITATTGPLSIGGNQAFGQYFAGLIDDLRIYDRALTDAEVQADMVTPVP
jgi:hypothetical protein